MTALAPRPGAGPRGTVEGLVAAAVDGDERAWDVICSVHRPRVRSVALARLRDPHAAEDVVQETFLRAWTRLHQVEDAHRLGAWLQTIAANIAVDHVRRRRVTAPLAAAAGTPAPGRSHDEHVVAQEEAAVLHARLAELRDVDRHALWQRDGHGVPVGELADELGMTSGAVRVLLHRARRRVREGYGLVTVPLAGLATRVRGRTAGLGDAVPAALAAPVLVVAVVVGVTAPAGGGAPPPGTSTTVAPTSAGAPTSTTPPGPAPADAAVPAAAPRDAAPVTTPAVAPGAPAPSPTRAPRVDLGNESAGFADDAPTDDRADVESGTAVGPVDGLELYLEESGVGELGQDCLLCD